MHCFFLCCNCGLLTCKCTYLIFPFYRMTSWLFYFNVASIVYSLYNIIFWRLALFYHNFWSHFKKNINYTNPWERYFYLGFSQLHHLRLSDWHFPSSSQFTGVFWYVKLDKIWDTIIPNLAIVYFFVRFKYVWS